MAFVEDWVENDFEKLPLSKRCLEIEQKELARRKSTLAMRIKYERASLKIFSEFEGGDFAKFRGRLTRLRLEGEDAIFYEE